MTTEDKLDRLNEMCRSTPDCADCNIYRAGLYYLCVAFTFETMGDKNVNLLYSTAFLKDVPTGSAPDNVNHPAHYQGAHECWRLMGFTDEAFHKAEAVCSNSQLYKQAGNSIVVDVLVGIFKNIFKED